MCNADGDGVIPLTVALEQEDETLQAQVINENRRLDLKIGSPSPNKLELAGMPLPMK